MERENRNLASNGNQEEPIQQNGRMYTVSQAASILHLPETWIYERTRKDAIPFRKMGKYIRFTDSDLQAILRMCSRGPRDPSPALSKKE
jgi:excisionase family DNA binding protein